MTTENIWGKRGCELPNGNLCEACCVKPQIDIGQSYAVVIKQAHSPCPHLNSQKGINGKGCELHPNKKPQVCSWHCSKADKLEKLDLIAQSLGLGQVNYNEAVKASQGVAGTSWTPFAAEQLVIRASILATLTRPRKLISGDIIEP